MAEYSGRRMSIRWRNIIPLSSALISLIITYNIVTQLPTDTVVDPDDIQELDGDSSLRQDFKLFPDDDNVESRNDEKRKRSDGERRRAKALLLFSEEDDDQDAVDQIAVPNDDVPPPGVNRDTQRADVQNAKQQQQVELYKYDEKIENNEPDATKQHGYSQDRKDDVDADLLPRNNFRQVVQADQTNSDVNDHNNRVMETKDYRPANVNKRPLVENVRNVGAIVQQLKRRSADKPQEEDDTFQSRAPVNPHPFSYVINCPQLCSDVDGPLFLVVYVHTATGHHKRRTIIRQTWGEVSQYDVNVRIVFVLGLDARLAGASMDTQTALAFEAERYQDIVQENFVDTYHNLTYKGIAALRWIDQHCSHAKFVLKTDDDIFVNMFSLLRLLKKMAREARRPNGLLMCCVWDSMPVQRSGKWKVTREEWPDDWYPTYCSGSAFIMSTDVAVGMHRVSYYVPFFWVDDFYITGLLPLRLGNVSHRQLASSYVLNGDRLEELFTGAQWYLYMFSEVHNLDRIQTVWNSVVQLAAGKIRPRIARRTIPRRQR